MQPMTDEDITYSAAITMLAAGEATMAEIASLIGTHRQTIRYWAGQQQLDPPAARRQWLSDRWNAYRRKAASISVPPTAP